MVATHDAGGGDLGTAMLLVTVALFVAMVVVFVMLARETRRRRQKETLR
jgi:preprotein translocase subunit YajC